MDSNIEKELKENLLHAVRTNSLDDIKKLIKAGADPNTSDNTRTTVLMHACENGWVEMVELLLEKGADPNFKNFSDKTAIRCAINSNNSDDISKTICEMLIEYKADPNIVEDTGYSALMWGVTFSRKKTVELLLQHGANPNQTTLVEKITPLMLATSYGNKKSVELLLDNRADINAQRKDGATALQLAIENGNIDIAKLLLQAGANPNIERYGADLCTPLIAAIHGRHFKLADDLINKYSADVNIESSNGWTALTYAIAAHNNIEFFDLVMTKNPKINTKISTGTTTLMHAVSCNDVRKVEVLLKKGADVNAKDNNGNTALMQAVRLINKPEKIAYLLMKYGADTNIKNNNGETALDIFNNLERENTQLITLLKDGYNKTKQKRLKENFSRQTKKRNSMRKYIKNNLFLIRLSK